MVSYRIYTSRELDEFVGKEVVVYFEGDGFWPWMSVEGLMTKEDSYYYLLHHNEMYAGSEPDDLKGYSYGFMLNGVKMDISLKEMVDYRVYTSRELDEFVGKEVVIDFGGNKYFPQKKVEGLVVFDESYYYLIHNDNDYKGAEPDDTKGYLFGYGLIDERMNITLKHQTSIKLINKSPNPDPEYATEQSAGCDIRAFIFDPITLQPLQRTAVPTGLYIELPEGYEAQIRPRSGLAYNHGVTVLNSPGTIDADYRGEIKVLLVNLSDKDFTINNGDRICQMVVTKYERLPFEATDSLSDTVRGDGGFGHT